MTETTRTRAQREHDNTSTQTLRVVQAVEDCEGRWLSDAPHDAERTLTAEYLADMAAHLRFARALYVGLVIDTEHLRMLTYAARRVVTYADERLDMVRA